MIDRRMLLKWSAATGLAAVPLAPALAAGEGIDALLVDTGYGTPPDTAAELLTFAGDVTAVWFDRIDGRWRRPGFVLAGITGSDTLFVLESLARQHGRAVVQRATMGVADARGVSLTSWIIAPVHPAMRA